MGLTPTVPAIFGGVLRVYINNRDLLSWPRAMANHLAERGHEVVFVDNDSSYPPLLEYYASCPHGVIHRPNLGATAPWTCAELKDERTPFVITDPDLDISGVPDDWPEVLLEGLNRWPNHTKCGFSLEDSDVPEANPAHHLDGFANGGNPKYWNPAREASGSKCSYFDYPIDTTFALYRPGATYMIDGHRTNRPYTARHLPFHLVVTPTAASGYQIPLDEELVYYYEHALSNFFGRFSTTKSRMWPLVEEFRRSFKAGPPPD